MAVLDPRIISAAMAWGSTLRGLSVDAAAASAGGGMEVVEEEVLTRVLRMRRRPDPLASDENARRDVVSVRLWRFACGRRSCRVRTVVA